MNQKQIRQIEKYVRDRLPMLREIREGADSEIKSLEGTLEYWKNSPRTKPGITEGSLDFHDELEGHMCTSDCRRIGCEEVEARFNRAQLLTA